MKEGAMMFKLERKNGDMEGSVRENIPGLRDWRIWWGQITGTLKKVKICEWRREPPQNGKVESQIAKNGTILGNLKLWAVTRDRDT